MRNILLEPEAMTDAYAPAEFTPEDLLAMEDGHRFDLVGGKLVERNTGARSSRIAAKLIKRLEAHAEAGRLGLVFATDCGYQAFADAPKKVRLPDCSFIAAGRLPNDEPPDGHVKIAPDLAVEVVSPNDAGDEIEMKRVEWLNAGVRLLWIAYPSTRTVHRYRPDGSSSVIGPDGELSGEDILPGFTCKVADLFA